MLFWKPFGTYTVHLGFFPASNEGWTRTVDTGHWRKSTNDRQGIRYRNYDAAFGTILRVRKGLQRSNDKLFMYRRRTLCTLNGAVDFWIVPSKAMYERGGSRAIKFLYAPERPKDGQLSSIMHLLHYPLQYGPWKLPRGLFTSLVYLWRTYAYAHVGMLVCTHWPFHRPASTALRTGPYQS
jgi:hypothetical protein